MTSDIDAGTCVLVHLSGFRRGSSEPLVGDELRVGGAPEAEIQLAGLAGWSPAENHAVLRRRGETFELEAAEGQRVWVNGEAADRMVLASGDVIEFGRGGPVLRFRRYEPGHGPHKTLAEVFSDCIDCARYEPGGVVRKAGVFLGRMPSELATQTSRTFRVALATALVVVVAGVGALATRTIRMERALARQAQEVRGLTALLQQTRPDSAGVAAARRELGGVEASLSAAQERLTSLEARNSASSQTILAAFRSTVFLQGAFGFVEARSGLPMRAALSADGTPQTSPTGESMVSTAGSGPLVELYFTGSGFIVGPNGLILTNKHVAQPWYADPVAGQAVSQGWRPVMRRFVGYLPGKPRAFGISFVVGADSTDLALVRGDGAARGAVPLNLRREPPVPGDQVIVLGYPMGIDALLARAEIPASDTLAPGETLDFWTVTEHLARAGQVTPLATRGIVGQSNARAIIYDAATTHGGSGGPVLAVDGAVIAVNAAILEGFPGSNMGVPAWRAAALLAQNPRR